jgi:hypothetical protein
MYSFLSMTQNHWGAGTTQEKAERQMRLQAGQRHVKQHGFVTYEFSTPTQLEVSPVNGSFQIDAGVRFSIVKNTTKGQEA